MGRAAVALLLAALLAAPAAAQPSASHFYPVEGRRGDEPVRGDVVVRRDGERLHVSGRLEGPGLPGTFRGVAERTADGWRLVLPGTPGAAGVLRDLGRTPQEVPPRILYLRRGPNDTLQGTLVGPDGQTLGTVRGAAPPEPPAPPPAGECRPTSDRWWSTHGVAAWELGRALWDFYKPGSRRLEELRGDVTQADTRAARARLERDYAPPYSPEELYAAARSLSPDPARALRLAFGLAVDAGVELPLERLPVTTDPKEPMYDKYEHFFASAIMAHRSNARGSFRVGWLKEVMDGIPGGSGYSEEDLMADALGAEFGQGLQCGEPPAPPRR